MVEPANRITLSSTRASVEEVWRWLDEVPDPEIPVVSVVDLGIVRDVRWSDEEEGDVCVVTVTPTYSGCPATEVIAQQIREAVLACGVPQVRLQVKLSPAWTTDWLTERAREKLREYGIVPPTGGAVATGDGMAPSLVVLGQPARSLQLVCPRCGSAETETISRFGSTPCKSLHRCLDCLEPFDHFKCH